MIFQSLSPHVRLYSYENKLNFNGYDLVFFISVVIDLCRVFIIKVINRIYVIHKTSVVTFDFVDLR